MLSPVQLVTHWSCRTACAALTVTGGYFSRSLPKILKYHVVLYPNCLNGTLYRNMKKWWLGCTELNPLKSYKTWRGAWRIWATWPGQWYVIVAPQWPQQDYCFQTHGNGLYKEETGHLLDWLFSHTVIGIQCTFSSLAAVVLRSILSPLGAKPLQRSHEMLSFCKYPAVLRNAFAEPTGYSVLPEYQTWSGNPISAGFPIDYPSVLTHLMGLKRYPSQLLFFCCEDHLPNPNLHAKHVPAIKHWCCICIWTQHVGSLVSFPLTLSDTSLIFLRSQLQHGRPSIREGKQALLFNQEYSSVQTLKRRKMKRRWEKGHATCRLDSSRAQDFIHDYLQWDIS